MQFTVFEGKDEMEVGIRTHQFVEALTNEERSPERGGGSIRFPNRRLADVLVLEPSEVIEVMGAARREPQFQFGVAGFNGEFWWSFHSDVASWARKRFRAGRTYEWTHITALEFGRWIRAACRQAENAKF